jgi:hypothetical protein
MKDEEIQNNIEKGLASHAGEDERIYKLIFNAAKNEPAFHVSLPFADRILAKIEKKEERRDYGWLAAGIFFSLVAMIVSLALTNANWNTGVFTFLSGYPGLVVFGVAFILFLHWIDKKLLRQRRSI